eukprot:m.90590 g.90590  ORF g.90590 m.90590 type:complete len:52 (+) comp12916_c0_seq12:139-294(+)
MNIDFLPPFQACASEFLTVHPTLLREHDEMHLCILTQFQLVSLEEFPFCFL